MVNGVPREVPRPKPEVPQAPRVFGRGTSRGTPFIMIATRLFHIMSFFRHLGLVKWDFFQPMDSLGSIMVNIQTMKHCILLELDSITLGRDVERIAMAVTVIIPA